MEKRPEQPVAAAPVQKSSLGKKLLIALGVIVAALGALAVVIAMQPEDFAYARTAKMAAPPEKVFEQVNDFHKWEGWSPWAKLDPNMKTTYEGPDAGTGASYSWVGNNEVGEGRMTITDSKPNELVAIKLEFMKPFAATNTAQFSFKPDGDQTAVTWSMAGKANFVMKAFHLFMDMDKMMGESFDKGLGDMKAIVEDKPQEMKESAGEQAESK